MGRNWAIVVGINNYDNLQPLKYAKKDAEGMAAWFKDEAEFDAVLLFTEDSPSIDQLDIYKAASPIPTLPIHARFLRFLNAQFERPLLKPEDNLWFFFAGHGKRYADQDYLMFLDSDPLAVDRTAISVNYVTQRLRRSGADNIVLFLDACRDEGSRAGLGVGEQRHQGVVTFYSCSANQQSWEIDELQHGAFTYTILEGLRLQGEMNCATVERLEQYLRHQVPQINTRYNKPTQNPYLQAEPPYKMYFILLEQAATLRDVEPLKYQASLAENRGELSLARQLWVRVLAASRGDWDAVDAIERIALRQRGNFQPIISSEPVRESSSGERSVNSEAVQKSLFTQREEQHQQNLAQYQQSFSQAIEQEFPLGEASRGRLRKLQQSLQLGDEEILEIERPVIAQKEAESRKQQQPKTIPWGKLLAVHKVSLVTPLPVTWATFVSSWTVLSSMGSVFTFIPVFLIALAFTGNNSDKSKILINCSLIVSIMTGTSIGQWWILRKFTFWAQFWVPSTLIGSVIAIGTCIAFGVYPVKENSIVVSLLLGFSVGTMQWLVLREYVHKSNLWLLFNIFGITICYSVCVNLDSNLSNIIVFVSLGGFIVITGFLMIWLLQHPNRRE